MGKKPLWMWRTVDGVSPAQLSHIIWEIVVIETSNNPLKKLTMEGANS
jgi:hypothetical protein